MNPTDPCPNFPATPSRVNRAQLSSVYQCLDHRGLSSLETMTVSLFINHPVTETEYFPHVLSASLDDLTFQTETTRDRNTHPTHMGMSHAVRFLTVQNDTQLGNVTVTQMGSELKIRCRRAWLLTHSFFVGSGICLFQQ